ncbi:MAG: ester cyclase, partial [Thermomicrobiales bacterium]
MATSTTRFDRLSTALATHLTRRSAISATAAGVAGTALLSRMGGAQTASPAASPAAGCATLSKEEMEAIAVRFFTEGLAQGNLAVIDEIYDPNGRHNAAFFPAAQDLESIKGVLSGLRTAFPDIQVSVDDVLSDGEFVVVRWTDTGTFTNEILGFAPTGSLVSWTGMNIFQFACGRIIESWAQSDTLTQLGLSDDSATSSAAPSSPEASPVAACTETSE